MKNGLIHRVLYLKEKIYVLPSKNGIENIFTIR